MKGTFRVFSILIFLGLLVSPAWGQLVVRGPYLQQQTDQSIIVRWRTDVATDSVVRYGTDSAALTSSSSDVTVTTEHTVLLSGLTAATEYFYSVGDSTAARAGDATFHFNTAPSPGAAAATRVWVIGDSGTANSNARAVRDAYKTWSASQAANFMLMLGDNAYNDGTDNEYQNAVFNTYPELLRQLPVWPTLGNHDGHSADSATQSGPYYDIFDLPTAAEAGGLASGTEAYYAFDYGNIHFVVLDSYDTDRSVGGNMLQWLESDLAINDKPWLIAFFHHPPYTKGSHNSDTEGQLIDMRQNALPILEAWGVDLVMTGHSHTYERSFLLDGHYGSSGTLDIGANIVDIGDGRETGDGVYQKPDIVAAENEGAVYAVAGSSGKLSTGYPLNHPAMFIALESLGSMVLDIAGDRMDATFLDQNALVKDEFTIMKTPDIEAPLISSAVAEDASHVLVEYSEKVDASGATNVGNYTIAGLSIGAAELLTGGRTVRLTTSVMTAGNSYVLVVNNVLDESGNTIAPDTQAGFEFNPVMTKTFQDGIAPNPAYDGTIDSYIREATATTNYGSATTIQVDGDEPSGSGTDMSIVIGWDVSDIPANATVESASVVLNTLNVGGPYSCYGLLGAWNQAETTWNEASSGNAWAVPGAQGAADRDNLVLCSFNAGVTGPITINLNVDGLALVQSWVDGSVANNGIIITDSVSSNGADFDSSESASAMNRPKLEIVYTVPVVPPNTPPIATFTESCSNLNCNFTDGSSDSDGTVVSWSWDFGDGNTSLTQNPAHTYASAGTYTVALTVTDSDGADDTASQAISVVGNVPPSASFSENCTNLDCGFTDTSTDSDGNIVAWSWTFGDGGTSSLQNPVNSYTAGGIYTVSLTVTDDNGASGNTSTAVTVSEPPAFVDYSANGQILVAGTVNGAYGDTQSENGISQSITERESGGKKQNRYSFLEHKWTFNVSPAAGFMFVLNAWSGGSADGDEFVFAWSSDDGSYTDLLTVSSSSTANVQTAALPDSLSGTVYIRVRDSDRTAGNKGRDTVYVDHMYIHAENAAGSPPDAPSDLVASALSANNIELQWVDNSDDESGFELQRSTDQISWTGLDNAGADAQSTIDIGLQPSTTYYYRTRAYNLSGSSAWTAVASATTGDGPPPPSISLTLTGSKNRGRHVVDLEWSGTTENSVNIYRDSALFTTVPDTGAYTDNTGNKGGRTYSYQVCETVSGDCSTPVNITF